MSDQKKIEEDIVVYNKFFIRLFCIFKMPYQFVIDYGMFAE